MKAHVFLVFLFLLIPAFEGFGQCNVPSFSGNTDYSTLCSLTPTGNPAINILNIGSGEVLTFDQNVTTTGNVELGFTAQGGPGSGSLVIPAGVTVEINGDLLFSGSNSPSSVTIEGTLIVTGNFEGNNNTQYFGSGTIRVDGNWTGNGGNADCPAPCTLKFDMDPGTCQPAESSKLCEKVELYLLPVELQSFTANYSTGVVNIQWVTVWEEDNDFFTLEKSADGKTWDEFRFVDGKGESYNPTTYRVFDDQPFPIITYYRLKQTDFNGEFTYSPSIHVLTDETLSLELSPNPASQEVQLTAGFDLSGSVIRLMDMQGRVFAQETLPENTGWRARQSLENLPSGLYMLVCMTNSGKTISQKLLVAE